MIVQPQIPAWQQTLVDASRRSAGEWQHRENGTFLERFDSLALSAPNAPALVDGDVVLTFRHLRDQADQLAQAFLNPRIRPGAAIALVFETEPLLLVAMLAALKSGRPFVLFDPKDPPARVEWVRNDSQAHLLVTSARLRQEYPTLFSQKEGVILVEEELAKKETKARRPLPIEPSDIACVLYTSGSTGRPKGVIIPHSVLAQRASQWSNAFYLSPQDRTALLRPAIVLAFGSLWSGGALHLWDHRRLGLEALSRWLAGEAITLLYMGATTLRQFLRDLSAPINLPALRLLLQSGEPLYRSDVEMLWRSINPPPLLGNLLMSREAGLMRRYFLTPDYPLEEEIVPVGYAVEDVALRLLDEEVVSPGQAQEGEIIVSGPGLVPGYWQRPDETRRRFIDMAPGGRFFRTGDRGRMLADGCLLFRGRGDQQLKIRGYRVEPGEVEEAIRKLGVVEDVAIVPQQVQSGENRLVAYLALGKRTKPTVTSIRNGLAHILPDYLIPSAFVMMDRFPLNAHGRLDLRALPLPDRHRPALDVNFAPPATPVESIVWNIWCELLGLKGIGIHDPFLELGGNSLQAMRIAARVQEEFSVEIPLAELFAAATVAEMALVVMVHLTEQLDSASVTEGKNV